MFSHKGSHEYILCPSTLLLHCGIAGVKLAAVLMTSKKIYENMYK